jgi:hypothetical protein
MFMAATIKQTATGSRKVLNIERPPSPDELD